MERTAALVLCGLLWVGGARAESVSDLVDQAKAQAAAQHLRSPPGDNAQETIDKLWGRLKEATPAQLKELSGIVIQLEASQSTPAVAPPDDASTRTPPARQVYGAALSDQSVPSAPAPLTPATQPALVAPSNVAANVALAAPPQAAAPQAALSAPGPRDQRLFELGQEAEARGDLSAARRFDMIAARNNEAPAALALGRLYDPAYLAEHPVIGGVNPDVAVARYWYERARDLGQNQAAALLTALPAR